MSAPRRRIVQGLTWTSIALFVVLVLVVMWQVFTRQVLQAPSAWTTTVSQYLFIWLVLFAVAMVFGERGHVAVDFFARLLPRPAQRGTSVLVEISILAFALLGLVWGGIRGMVISFDQAIPGLPVSVGQMYLALPIAGVLIALFAAEDLVRAARGEDLLGGDDAQTEAALEAAGADADGAPEEGRSSAAGSPSSAGSSASAGSPSADGASPASPSSPTEQKGA